MNRQTKQYIKELKANLKCSHAYKNQLTSQFNYSLASFLEEVPDPTPQELNNAFGPPQEMAFILMNSIPEKEQINHAKRKKLIQFVFTTFAALFIAFSLYVFFEKEYAEIISYDEVFPDETITSQGSD